MSNAFSLKSFFITWLLGGFVTIAILALITMLALDNGGWLGYFRLVQDGVSSQATIIQTYNRNHCRADYSFSVGNSKYTGRGTDCGAEVGQLVEITYLRSNPGNSCLDQARSQLDNELATFAAAGVIFPVVFYFAMLQRKKKSPSDSIRLTTQSR